MRKVNTLFLLITLFVQQASAQWTKITASGGGGYESMVFLNTDDGFAAGATGIMRTSNGGASWSPSLTLTGTRDIDFIDDQTGFAIGIIGLMRKTVNGGISWNSVTPPNSSSLWGISMVTKDIMYVSLVGGKVYKTINGGTNFTTQNVAGSSITLQDIFFSDASNGCAVGSGGSIYRTSNGGTNWSSVYTTPIPAGLYSIYFPTAMVGYTVGSGGSIAKSTDGGATWSTQISGTNKLLSSVHFFDALNGMAVGDSGTVLRTLNGGSNWFKENIGTTDELQSVFLLSASSAIVGATNSFYSNPTLSTGSDKLIIQNLNISIYPNPANNLLHVNGTSSTLFDFVNLSVFDVTGNCVFTAKVHIGDSEFDISSLSKGCYVVVLTGQNTHKYIRKLLKE